MKKQGKAVSYLLLDLTFYYWPKPRPHPGPPRRSPPLCLDNGFVGLAYASQLSTTLSSTMCCAFDELSGSYIDGIGWQRCLSSPLVFPTKNLFNLPEQPESSPPDRSLRPRSIDLLIFRFTIWQDQIPSPLPTTWPTCNASTLSGPSPR